MELTFKKRNTATYLIHGANAYRVELQEGIDRIVLFQLCNGGFDTTAAMFSGKQIGCAYSGTELDIFKRRSQVQLTYNWWRKRIVTMPVKICLNRIWRVLYS
eukprot:1148880_1